MRIMTMMLVGVTSGFLGITNANAGIIFQQPQLIPGGYESDAASQAFDDFQFSSPISIIDKIDWEGNITTGKQASGFQLEIYSDSGGRPGSLIYVEDLSFTQTLLEDDGPSQNYGYSAILENPFGANGGSRYWISIVAADSPSSDGILYGWDLGKNGNNISYIGDGSYPPGLIQLNSDFAFTLEGTVQTPAVPEPNTSILMALGIVVWMGHWCLRRRP